jgi:hypothetical protein
MALDEALDEAPDDAAREAILSKVRAGLAGKRRI